MIDQKLKSSTMWIALGLIAAATVGLCFGKVQYPDWMNFCQWIGGLYIGKEAVHKIAKSFTVIRGAGGDKEES